MPAKELVEKAVLRVRTGELPCIPSHQMLAGAGRGHVCSVCGGSIAESDVGYEIEPDNLHGGYQTSLFFHVPCYDAWVVACAKAPLSVDD